MQPMEDFLKNNLGEYLNKFLGTPTIIRGGGGRWSLAYAYGILERISEGNNSNLFLKNSESTIFWRNPWKFSEIIPASISESIHGVIFENAHRKFSRANFSRGIFTWISKVTSQEIELAG